LDVAAARAVAAAGDDRHRRLDVDVRGDAVLHLRFEEHHVAAAVFDLVAEQRLHAERLVLERVRVDELRGEAAVEVVGRLGTGDRAAGKDQSAHDRRRRQTASVPHHSSARVRCTPLSRRHGRLRSDMMG
jgi:hypothetical protein